MRLVEDEATSAGLEFHIFVDFYLAQNNIVLLYAIIPCNICAWVVDAWKPVLQVIFCDSVVCGGIEVDDISLLRWRFRPVELMADLVLEWNIREIKVRGMSLLDAQISWSRETQRVTSRWQLNVIVERSNSTKRCHSLGCVLHKK